MIGGAPPPLFFSRTLRFFFQRRPIPGREGSRNADRKMNSSSSALPSLLFVHSLADSQETTRDWASRSSASHGSLVAARAISCASVVPSNVAFSRSPLCSSRRRELRGGSVPTTVCIELPFSGLSIFIINKTLKQDAIVSWRLEPRGGRDDSLHAPCTTHRTQWQSLAHMDVSYSTKAAVAIMATTTAGASGGPVQWMNLRELQLMAKEVLSPMAYGYYASGAADQSTLRDNEDSFRNWRLRPRVLVDVTTVDLSLPNLCGTSLSSPLLIAPMAFQGLADKAAELATARAAASAGIGFCLSTCSNVPLEDVAAAFGPSPRAPLFYQVYVMKDRSITEALVKRAHKAGFTGPTQWR